MWSHLVFSFLSLRQDTGFRQQEKLVINTCIMNVKNEIVFCKNTLLLVEFIELRNLCCYIIIRYYYQFPSIEVLDQEGREK